eukprot:TRINITY_DN27815_c0_g1_i1.p1 TRINITY_DN27815_c0_g1~~TRINITY_DN27815_c0_g1_i1.p1  ORF type:complete len:427 (-),score=66.23 TRINITY_DN27815_c0_g1_i1:44-1324(-)
MFSTGLFLALFVTISLALDCHHYDDVYRAIDAELTENPELIPTIVRLAFHDCVGPACDGCINIEDPNNAGLDAATNPLEAVYTHFDDHLSRSDFWQLAAHVSLIRGGLNVGCNKKHCEFFDLQYQFGRKDCKTSPFHYHIDDAGDAHGDWDELERVMGQFDLDDEEIVTLMGAHSLGGADTHNSGFKYNWQVDHLNFDNGYYQNMVKLHYEVENVAGRKSSPKMEFVADSGRVANEAPEAGDGAEAGAEVPEADAEVPEVDAEDPEVPEVEAAEAENEEVLMLNVDMALLRNLHSEQNKKHRFTGAVKCPSKKYDRNIFLDEGVEGQVEQCEYARTAHLVKEYAKNLDKFYDAFPSVWAKVNSHGCENLSAPVDKRDHKCGWCIPSQAFCVAGFEKAGKCCPGYECVDNKCQKEEHKEYDDHYYRH